MNAGIDARKIDPRITIWGYMVMPEFFTGFPMTNSVVQNSYASLKLESTFTQKNNSVFETNSNAYNLVHIALGGKVILNKTKFEINLNINNVFDTEYIAHLSRLKTDGVQNIGRNVVLGLSFNI